MTVQKSTILEKFEDTGLTSKMTAELYELIDICSQYNLNEQTLLDKFETWQLNSNQTANDINMSMISRFKLEGLKKLKQPYMPKPNIANITAVSKKVKKEILASPLAFTSPASESFAKRTQKGKVIAEVGDEFIQFATDEADVVVKGNKGDAFCYMGQKPIEISDIFGEYIINGIEQTRKELEIDQSDEGNLMTTTQEPIEICGMIMHDGTDVVLTNGDEEMPLDFEDTESFHIYSGMFCCVRGVNPNGHALVVESIRPVTFTTEVEEKMEKPIQNTTVLIAAGPYFTSDTVSQDPINELLNQVKEHKPNLTILIGPFLDEKHFAAESGEIGGSQIIGLLREKISEIEGSGSRALLLSSPRDLLAEPVYPTPVYSAATIFGQGQTVRQLDNVATHMNGDPCFIELNGWKLAITSNDILIQMARAEKVRNLQSEKMKRIGESLLAARSLQPIQPGPLGLNLDYHKLDRVKFPPGFEPDAIIAPSVLNATIKSTNEKGLLINPGYLTKGKGGGSFGLLQFNTNGHKARVVKI